MADDVREMFIDNSDFQQNCIFCEKRIKSKEYTNIISKALARKYCANHNQMYYLKDIIRVLGSTRY